MGLRNPENQSRVESRLVTRPFTVEQNSKKGGSASIRKGLGTEKTTFLVSSYSIIASENVSGRVSGENFKSPGKAIFTIPEGSQSGGVPILPIRKGSCFCQSGGYYFCQFARVLILSIRKGPILSKLK